VGFSLRTCRAFSCSHLRGSSPFSAFFPHLVLIFSSYPPFLSSTAVLIFSGDVRFPLGVRFRYRFGVAGRVDFSWIERQDLVRKVGLAMATHPETVRKMMTKKPETTSPAKSAATQTERRGNRRCRITQLMRIRPSDPKKPHFEDLRGSMSVSRSGVYFQSSETGYEVGLRLFVTMPYSNDPASLNREYLAEVVRRDVLPTGMYGIGIKILMEMGIQHSYNFASGTPF